MHQRKWQLELLNEALSKLNHRTSRLIVVHSLIFLFLGQHMAVAVDSQQYRSHAFKQSRFCNCRLSLSVLLEFCAYGMQLDRQSACLSVPSNR